MIEQEWLACNDPVAMLDWYNSESDYRPSVHPVITDRQLRLFACACCRRSWHLLTDARSRQAVEVAERYADSATYSEEMIFAHAAANEAMVQSGASFEFELAWRCAGSISGLTNNAGLPRWFSVSTKYAAAQANLLRDIIGNPFRPVTIDPSWLTWNDGAIPRLAQTAYEERVARTCERCRGTGRSTKSTINAATAKCGFCGGKLVKRTDLEEPGLWWCTQCWVAPKSFEHVDCDVCHGTGTIASGELDPARLQILADALEESGCDNETILSHLRSPGPHVRGCWAIDALRGMK